MDLKLIDAEEVAKSLGVSRNMVYMMARIKGGLPCVKVGRKVRFMPSAIKAWIEAGGLK